MGNSGERRAWESMLWPPMGQISQVTGQ